MRAFVTLCLALLLGLAPLSGPARAANSHVRSADWQSLLDAIRDSAPAALQGRSFSLEVVEPGYWTLVLTPAAAFRVESRDGTRFVVTVVDADLLYEEAGGLLLPREISYRIQAGGSGLAVPELVSSSGCRYPISFAQKNGLPLDFEKLKTAFQVEFLYDKGLLRLAGTGAETAIFDRIGAGRAYVTLRLSRGSQIITSDAVEVPACEEFREPSGELAVIRKPGHCIIRGGELARDPEAPDKGRAYYYYNTCPEPVTCTFNHTYRYYNSKFDEETQQNPVLVEKVDYSLNFSPLSSVSYYSSDAPDYKWKTRSQVPGWKGEYGSRYIPALTEANSDYQYMGWKNADFRCVWGDLGRLSKADYRRLVEYAERKSDPGMKVAYLRRALERWPDWQLALFKLSWIYVSDRQWRNPAEALELASRMVAANRSAAHLYVLAAALAENGNFDKAVDIQKEALAMAPEDELEKYSRRLVGYNNGLTLIEQ